MEHICRIGMDTSKHFFQLYGVNAAEEPVLRKKLRRKDMVAFFEKLAPTVVAIEACGGSHHWARLLSSFGHQVKLIAPQLVKPYVKRGKNDAADAEALCEAMSRPTMRFVPVKTAEQQAAVMLVGVRDRLIRNRTQPANSIRGYASEFGLTAPKGMAHLDPLIERIQADESLPDLARELFAAQAKEYEQLQAQIDEVDVKLKAWHHADECGRRLAQNSRRRSNRRGAADDENPGARDVPIRSAIRSLDRLDAEGSFYRRQGQARRHHASRRRGFAQRIGGESDSAPQVCSKRQKQKCALALARAASEAKASETGRRGAGQQACPHRPEADGHRPKLRPEIHTHHRGGSGLKISQPRGAHQMQPC